MEGKELILTLKDKGVLDEEGDSLVNVNLIDEERYKKVNYSSSLSYFILYFKY